MIVSKWAKDFVSHHPEKIKKVFFISHTINMLIIAVIMLFIIHYFVLLSANHFQPLMMQKSDSVIIMWISLFAVLISLTAISEKKNNKDLEDLFSAIADFSFLLLMLYLLFVPLIPYHFAVTNYLNTINRNAINIAP